MDLFGTAGIRGKVSDTVTPELCLNVGRAVGQMTDEVVLGRDGRVTGKALAEATASGLLSAGVTVKDIGMFPTSALAFASRQRF
ncbi:MAG: phosphomannomutase, partial [Halobacteriaceae archaeon]